MGQLASARPDGLYRPACVSGSGSPTIDREDEPTPKDCREDEPCRRVSIVAKSGCHPVENGQDDTAEDERQTGDSLHTRLTTATPGSVQIREVSQRPDKNWKRSKLL